ncbi:MAG TPA: hypothetical protein VLZ50_00475 [Terracidiphilus sp.]|nr:hypothetical protein [Terracidiphilus sp.]
MRHRFYLCLLASMLFVFSRPAAAQPHSPMSAEQVERSARAFMQTVAHDVTQQGPTAWRKFFSHGPRFFMATGGHLVFPNYTAADKAIDGLASTIKHIDLTWGNEVRVDPLSPTLAVVATPWHEVRTTTAGRVEDSGFFTGTVEYMDGRWQFRDLHWSEADSAAPKAKPVTQ